MHASSHATLRLVTERIRWRSAATRSPYLARIDRLLARPRGSDRLGCANVAHAFAALPASDKFRIVAERAPHIGVVSAYNDMLSAHQPYESYPALIRDEARRLGATVQVAGGVPAMCDGVTQGQPGMELSLFSRDTIAMGTAIALSHDVFDGALLLGICDKIMPGLLIGALHFGHLPCDGAIGARGSGGGRAGAGASADGFRPIGRLVDERVIVIAMVALLATGGST